MKIRPLGAKFREDGRKDERTDRRDEASSHPS